MVPGDDPLALDPTAKQLVADVHATLLRLSVSGSRLGLATIDQRVPFQRSMRL